MPQMSPLYWDLIYSSMMTLFLISSSKIYFSTPVQPQMKESSSQESQFSLKKQSWSW